MISRPRGTRDLLPEDMVLRLKIVEACRQSASLFGFQEIATPTFEHVEVFTARSGQEIVEQMYVFQDRSGRSLALRPELTAPVIRMYAQEMRSRKKPLKLSYFGNCYRYERPQKGRYREFLQFGAEVIGASGPVANTELIALAVHALRSSGLERIDLRIGNLDVLRGLLEAAGVSHMREVMRLIDKSDADALRDHLDDEIVRIVLESDVKAARELTSVGFEDLDLLTVLLMKLGIEHRIDLSIARGLDYYAGTVFEIDVPGLGAERQVCGGGSYQLGEIFGLGPLDATGFAIGVDRVAMALGQPDVKDRRIDVFIAPLIDSAYPPALDLAMDLRSSGVRCDINLEPERPALALKRANSAGARWIVFLGEVEVQTRSVSLRDLETREQVSLKPEEAVRTITARI